MTNERVLHHYAEIVRKLKDVLNDEELTDKEKISVLGTIL